MAGEIVDAVLPFAVHMIGWLLDDRSASGTGTCTVLPRVLHSNHDRHRDAFTGAGRTSRSGCLGDDKGPVADTHLHAMPVPDPHMLDRPESRGQPDRRRRHIGIGEYRDDGDRRDGTIGFHG
jgi:hypothetical protein